MTDEEVVVEIERLKRDKYVKLAKKAENGALRQKMYHLRYLEKKGRELAKELELETILILFFLIEFFCKF